MKPLLCSLVSWGLVSLVALGALLRVTVKDAFPVLATIFYATPPAVLAFLAAVSGLAWSFRGQRRFARLLFGVSLLCGVWWWGTSFVSNTVRRADTAANPRTTIVFWNVSSGFFGETNVIDELRQYDPDILGLAEVGDMDEVSRRRWQRAFPHHVMSEVRNGNMLMCRGQMSDTSDGLLGHGGHYIAARIVTAEGAAQVVLADIFSSPLMHRRNPIAAILRVTAKFRNEPLLIIGDMNTPGDSIHFDLLRGTFRNAFESHGSGHAATWPIPLPVLQLDHIWVNDRIEILSCEAGWTWHSDHRPLVAEFRLRDSPDGT